jgi:glutaredoxin
MKRSILWVLAGSLVLLTGFFAGNHLTRFVREFMAPDPVRIGDFRVVTDAVGSEVVLISTTTCPWCQKARAWLKAEGVTYRDCVIDVDPFAKAQLETISAETVPQLVSRTTVVSGYDERAFRNLVRSTAASATLATASARCDDPG